MNREEARKLLELFKKSELDKFYKFTQKYFDKDNSTVDLDNVEVEDDENEVDFFEAQFGFKTKMMACELLKKKSDKLLLNLYTSYVQKILSLDVSMLDHENILYKDYILLKENDDLREPKNVTELFENPKFFRLKLKPIFKQDNDNNSRFTFINGDLIGLAFGYENNNNDFDTRIYLSPASLYMGDIIKEIINKQFENGLFCLMKFCTDNSYNDRVILYVKKENFSKFIEIIENIKKEHPDYFEKMNKNPLWNDIDGHDGIYFGEEPSLVRSDFDTAEYSYGSLRAHIFELALVNTLSKLNINDKEFSDIELSDDFMNVFMKYFRLICLRYNVNPDKIGFNLSNDLEKVFDIGYKDGKTGIVNYDKDSMKLCFGDVDFPEAAIQISEDDLLKLYNSEDNEIRDEILNKLQDNMNDYLHEQELIRIDKVRNEQLKFANPFKKYIGSMIPTTQIPFNGIVTYNDDNNSFSYKFDDSIFQKLQFYKSKYISLLFEKKLNADSFDIDLELEQLISDISSFEKEYIGSNGTILKSANEEFDKFSSEYDKSDVKIDYFDVLCDTYVYLKTTLLSGNYLDGIVVEEFDKVSKKISMIDDSVFEKLDNKAKDNYLSDEDRALYVYDCLSSLEKTVSVNK